MTSYNGFLSTIETVPVSYFVYSSLSAFAPLHGGSLPGLWFVRALSEAGREPAAVRQTLYRMEREHELVTTKIGKSKVYSPSSYARGEISAGTEKIFQTPSRKWDHDWTFVHLHFRNSHQRLDRERIVALLGVEGFAHLGGDAYVHPDPNHHRLRESLPSRVRRYVVIVRGRLVDQRALPALLELWNVDQLAERYRQVVDRLERLERKLRVNFADDRVAFLLRFGVVFDYLQVAWDDPGLPREILPRNWPGHDARRLAGRLYKHLLPAARRFAEELLVEVSLSGVGRSRSNAA